MPHTDKSKNKNKLPSSEMGMGLDSHRHVTSVYLNLPLPWSLEWAGCWFKLEICSQWWDIGIILWIFWILSFHVTGWNASSKDDGCSQSCLEQDWVSLRAEIWFEFENEAEEQKRKRSRKEGGSYCQGSITWCCQDFNRMIDMVPCKGPLFGGHVSKCRI